MVDVATIAYMMVQGHRTARATQAIHCPETLHAAQSTTVFRTTAAAVRSVFTPVRVSILVRATPDLRQVGTYALP